MQYIILDQNFSVKGDRNRRFLCDIRTGKKYHLNAFQFKIIRNCNGTLIKDNLIKKMKVSPDKINCFLRELQRIKALEYRDYKKRRSFVYLSKAKQLRNVHWEITNLCNLNCLHCYQLKYLRNKEDISLAECKRIIHEMADLGVEKVLISGGEPLMRNDLLHILGYLEKNSIQISSIFTNGLLISEDLLSKLKSFKSKISFNISLDGISPESLKIRGFDTLVTQKQALEKILSNILLAKKYGFLIRINTIINKLNYLEMEEMYKRLAKIGGLSWSIGFPRKMGSCIINRSELVLDFNKILTVCKNLIRYHIKQIQSKKQIVDLKIQYLFHKKFFNRLDYYSTDSFICNYEGRESMCCIKPNGDVLPCSVLFNYATGNVMEDNLYDIWHSKAMRKIKETKIKNLDNCKKCKYLSLCGGGCRATADIFYKDIRKKDPLACVAMEYFHKYILPMLKYGKR